MPPLVTDPHSPPSACVDRPVHDIDGWPRPWTVKPDDSLRLVPKGRARIR